MQRRTGPYSPGDRFLLQFPGGLERLAEVLPPLEPGRAPHLSPLPLEEPLPPHVVPGGEWLLGEDERLVRDWNGLYWSVSAREVKGVPFSKQLPAVCEVEFHRHTPAGERTAYRALSPCWTDALGDLDLAALFRHAWESLQTDEAERRRRSGASRAVVEL